MDEIRLQYRSMACAYAKDKQVSLTNNGLHPKDFDFKSEEEYFDHWGGIYFEFIIKEQKTPASLSQRKLITELLDKKDFSDKFKYHVRENLNAYNMEEASFVIDTLMAGELPKEYQDDYLVKGVTQKVKEKAERDTG